MDLSKIMGDALVKHIYSFSFFILLALLVENPALTYLILGGSFAYVMAVTIHTLHHTIEEIRKK
jgi:hypothetical protein